jgi:hypothetical protein
LFSVSFLDFTFCQLTLKFCPEPTSFKLIYHGFVICRTLSANVPTKYPHDAPERDFANFPAPRMPIHPGKVRMGLFPNEWFEAMYEKTGVTGPYILVWGSIAAILSKEYYVYWVDTFEHMVMLGIYIGAVVKYGPAVAAYLDKGVEKDDAALKAHFEAGVVGLFE